MRSPAVGSRGDVVPKGFAGDMHCGVRGRSTRRPADAGPAARRVRPKAWGCPSGVSCARSAESELKPGARGANIAVFEPAIAGVHRVERHG